MIERPNHETNAERMERLIREAPTLYRGVMMELRQRIERLQKKRQQQRVALRQLNRSHAALLYEVDARESKHRNRAIEAERLADLHRQRSLVLAQAVLDNALGPMPAELLDLCAEMFPSADEARPEPERQEEVADGEQR